MGRVISEGLNEGPPSNSSFVILGGMSKKRSAKASSESDSEKDPSSSTNPDNPTKRLAEEAIREGKTKRMTGGSDF